MSKVKLLFVLDPVDAFNVDASERNLGEIVVMMDKKWEVHLTSSRMVSYKKLPCDNKVHKVTLVSSPRSILPRALYLVSLIYTGVKIVRKHRIHAIIAPGGHLHLGLAAYLISRITKRKCVVRVNENDVLTVILFLQTYHRFISGNRMFLRTIDAILRKIEIFLFERVDWIVTQGPMDYEKIRKLTKKITFVPMWVDAEKFKPVSKATVKKLKRELLGIEQNVKVILFVGRLHPEKNIETLFYAYKKVLETHRNVILAVVGTGPEGKNCREMVERLGLTDKVKFLGYIPHEQIPKYYNVADIYVLTSIWEEWSNTIMEAMASCVPVIATNVGGNPYLVKDKETGFLVPPKVPHVLAEKIRYVLDHSNEMEKITSNACLSMRKFSKQDIGELYKKTIVEVIKDKALAVHC